MSLLAGFLAPAKSQNLPKVHYKASISGSSSLQAPVKTYGSKSAPIAVEAFTCYGCPACRALFEQALKPMIKDYVASGKVYLIHHDFPLVIHAYSGQAARWANAAAEVGEFGPAEAALFDNQPSWEMDGNISKFIAAAMPAADFQRIQAILKPCTTPAPQVTRPGVDPLAKSGTSCPLDSFIAQDIKLGNDLGVARTPTYTIYYRGDRILTTSGLVTWFGMRQFFDELLER